MKSNSDYLFNNPYNYAFTIYVVVGFNFVVNQSYYEMMNFCFFIFIERAIINKDFHFLVWLDYQISVRFNDFDDLYNAFAYF